MVSKDDLYLVPTASLRAHLARLEMLQGGTRTELVDRLWQAMNVYENDYNSDEEDLEDTEREALIAECRARGLRIVGASGDMRARLRRDHNRRKRHAVARTPTPHRITKRTTLASQIRERVKRFLRMSPVPSPETATRPSPSQRYKCSCRCAGCECNGSSSSQDGTSIEGSSTTTNSPFTWSPQIPSGEPMDLDDLTGNSKRTCSLGKRSDTVTEDPTAANSQRTCDRGTASDVVMVNEMTTHREHAPSSTLEEASPCPGFYTPATSPSPPPSPRATGNCKGTGTAVNEPGPCSLKRRRSEADPDEEEEHSQPRRLKVCDRGSAGDDTPSVSLPNVPQEENITCFGISSAPPPMCDAATSMTDSPSLLPDIEA
ncbi:hypothetical protein SLS62_000627 [Diatrype stigma]|uniref:Uncharacterized protein n=1 Tax=Diatrype stigma TaxID=117547 RepID=A0AAN9V395_9PEZI